MSTFRYNSTGINPDTQYPLIPDGWWPFKIVEAEAGESKSGYPMVTVKAKCLDPRQEGKGNVFHYVVFLPKGQKGDGMNVHFRKSIGVPWEGDILINTDEWEGKKFMGKVVSEEYNGKTNNKFKEISPIKDDIPFGEPEPTVVEDSPFQD